MNDRARRRARRRTPTASTSARTISRSPPPARVLGPGALVGVSTHDARPGARRGRPPAPTTSASGPIFATTTKARRARRPRSRRCVRAVRAAVALPARRHRRHHARDRAGRPCRGRRRVAMIAALVRAPDVAARGARRAGPPALAPADAVGLGPPPACGSSGSDLAVLEPGELAQERQLDVADRPVALLGDDDLGDALACRCPRRTPPRDR